MKKWLALGVAVLAVAGALAYLVANFDGYLNENRDWIAARLESSLGRPVRFDSIGVSLRGGLGVRVANLRVADDAAFSDGDLIRADDARVHVKILPALRGRYEIGRVQLTRPVVTLVRTEQGLNLATLGATGGEAEAPPAADATASTASTAAGVVIAMVNIEDGTLRFQDRTAEPATEIVVERIRFEASEVASNTPVRFDLRAALLEPDGTDLHVEGRVGPLGAPFGQTPLEARITVAPMTAERLSAHELTRRAVSEGLRTEGPVAVGAELSGTLDLLDIAATVDATDAAISRAGSFAKPAGVPLRVDLSCRRTESALTIDRGVLRLGDSELTASGAVDLGDAASYELVVQGEGLDPAAWSAFVPALEGVSLAGAVGVDLQLRKESAPDSAARLSGRITLTDVSARAPGVPHVNGLDTTITLSNGAAKMAPTTVDLAGSEVRLAAEVADLSEPVLSFEASSPALRARSLGVAAEPDQGEEVLRSLTARGTARPADGGADLSATIASTTGVLRGIAYEDLRAGLRVENRRALLSPLSLRAFGGRLSGEGVYDMNSRERPEFNLESELRGVEIAKLPGLGPSSSGAFFDGALDADLSLAGSGNDWESVRSALVGGGRMELRKGVLRDVNLVEEVLTAATGVPGLSALVSPRLREKYRRLFATGNTHFDTLAGLFTVAHGRLTSDDLGVRAPDYSLDGRMGIGLDLTFDIAATFEASPQLTEDLVSEVALARYLKGSSGRVQIPFTLAGSPTGIRVQPDTGFLTQTLKRALVDSVAAGLVGRPAKKQERAGAGDAAGTENAADRSGEAPASGGDAEAPPSPPTDTPAEPPASPVEQLLRGGLEELLGR